MSCFCYGAEENLLHQSARAFLEREGALLAGQEKTTDMEKEVFQLSFFRWWLLLVTRCKMNFQIECLTSG